MQDSHGVRVLGDTQKKQIAIPCAMPISLIYAHVLKALPLVYSESYTACQPDRIYNHLEDQLWRASVGEVSRLG